MVKGIEAAVNPEFVVCVSVPTVYARVDDALAFSRKTNCSLASLHRIQSAHLFECRRGMKGAVHAPVGDWSRRPIPMGLFLVIDIDELSKLFAYEKSLSTIVSE